MGSGRLGDRQEITDSKQQSHVNSHISRAEFIRQDIKMKFLGIICQVGPYFIADILTSKNTEVPLRETTFTWNAALHINPYGFSENYSIFHN